MQIISRHCLYLLYFLSRTQALVKTVSRGFAKHKTQYALQLHQSLNKQVLQIYKKLSTPVSLLYEVKCLLVIFYIHLFTQSSLGGGGMCVKWDGQCGPSFNKLYHLWPVSAQDQRSYPPALLLSYLISTLQIACLPSAFGACYLELYICTREAILCNL